MIKVEQLSFGYKRKQAPLFNQFDLSLSLGNIYGLLGQNGAGKSTLLKLLAGLLVPRKGHIYVGGLTPKARAPQFLREVYLVTEEFYLPPFSIQKFVALYSPFYPRFSHEALSNYLQEFGLQPNQKLTGLSYGQKKKFLLSFGLATDCQWLILDEPTNGLDIPAKSQFRQVLASAIHDQRSFVISTHQIRDMEALIDPIIILEQGKLVFHQSYECMAQKLTMSKQKNLPSDDHLIYAESGLGGYTVVQENTTQAETNLSLELLFKAVINNQEKINQIFNK
ncbi:ATP-binding cassette domain-containing protein [uncultured Microscilla sp.]|uniref:ABC transporter ATP-binding protein n=1 Tax=uncultured Microscilla sp. TaxID=432653 RepID=UPI0026278773|nr:ABC transporter ATP-binding protein [uncultured Microscilla sp.]